MNKLFLVTIAMLLCLGAGAQDLKPKKDKETKKYGYVNEAGEWAVAPTYDDADKLKDGYGVIYSAKKRGLIDASGKVILEPRFDDIDRFKDGFAQVELNDKKGLITPDGKVLIEPQFDKIAKFSDGVAEVKNNDKYGIISDKGQILFEPVFDRITSFDKEGNADVETSDKWGLINRSGKTLFEPQFSERLRFETNGMAVARRGSVKGIVKNDGQVVFDFNAEDISYEQNTYVIGTTNDWRLYSDNLKPVSGKYDEMEGFLGFGAGKKYIRDNKVAVRKGDKWGFISADGEEVIAPKFDALQSDGFRCSLCAVKVGDKWGYVKPDGSWFREPEFDVAGSFVGLGSSSGANVEKDGKKYCLKSDGTLIDKSPAPAPAPAAATASTAPATATQTVAAAPQTLNAAPAQRTTVAATPAPAQPAVDESAWLAGNWVVEEEFMGTGKSVKGDKSKYCRFELGSDKLGCMVERDRVTREETKGKRSGWSLEGSKLEIGNTPFTVTELSADKRSMTLKGILGTWWKVRKK